MWVGYELVLQNSALGLSASTAQWLEGWYTRLLRGKSVQMHEFLEGLGRAAFVSGALDYDRPGTPVCQTCSKQCEATPAVRSGDHCVPVPKAPADTPLRVRTVQNGLVTSLARHADEERVGDKGLTTAWLRRSPRTTLPGRSKETERLTGS